MIVMKFIRQFSFIMMLLILCSTSVGTMAKVQKMEAHLEEGQFLSWEMIHHSISAKLDLKSHLLKATDLMTLHPGEGDFKAFLNSSFHIHSVSLSSGKRAIKEDPSYGLTLGRDKDEKSPGSASGESQILDHREEGPPSSEREDKSLEFSFLKEYDLAKFFPSFGKGWREKYRNASLLLIKIPKEARTTGKPFHILISYEGEVYDPPKRAKFSRENVADQTTGIIGEVGVYLSESSHWYPTLPDSFPSFDLEVSLPSEYEVISEGHFVGKDIDQGLAKIRWSAPYPTEFLHLIAGKYLVRRSDYHGIEVSTYLFPEEQHLSLPYIQAVKKYLKMYEEMIGPYPYKKFSVVENFFPTGYGMASLTLLGRQVMKLPFIIRTSLGHEVLHNWWGNSVFVDYEKGNWCEGLTTYLSDYHYQELKSPEAAEQYRREVCQDYTNYVIQSGEDFPLTSFHERTTPATRAIGYGKTLMLFHMLRGMIGDEIFYESLKEFYHKRIWTLASWKDLEEIFEQKSKKDLSWFFHQWLDRAGAPFLQMEEPRLIKKEGKYEIHLVLRQEENPYRLSVPIEIQTEKGQRTAICSFGVEDLSASECRLSLVLKAKPLFIKVDPHQDIFRRLYFEEIPPLLSGALGDRNLLVIMAPVEDQGLKEAYQDMASDLTRTGKSKIRNPKDLTEKDLRTHSFFILGDPSRIEMLKMEGSSSLEGDFLIGSDFFLLHAQKYRGEASFLYMMKSPWNKKKNIAIFAGLTAKAVRASGQKLFHYGKYSYLVFQSGKNIAKGVHPISSNPLAYQFD